MANVTLPTILAREEYAIGAATVLMGDPTVANGDGMLNVGRVPSVSVSLNPSKAMASDVGGHQIAAATFDRGVNPEISITLNDVQQRLLTAMMAAAEIPNAEASITAVDDTADTFTVSGDVSALLGTGDVFTVTGSTGNDGDWTVDSVTYDTNNDETDITVQEDITDATADGKAIGFVEGMLFKTDQRKISVPTLCVVPQGKEANAVDKSGVWWFPAVTDTGVGDLTFEDAEGEDANNPIDFTLKALLREQDQNGSDLPDGARIVFTTAPANVPGTSLDWKLPGTFSTST